MEQKELFNVPYELYIKDDKVLLEKLKKGMEDTNNKKIVSLESAFEEVRRILEN